MTWRAGGRCRLDLLEGGRVQAQSKEDAQVRWSAGPWMTAGRSCRCRTGSSLHLPLGVPDGCQSKTFERNSLTQCNRCSVPWMMAGRRPIPNWILLERKGEHLVVGRMATRPDWTGAGMFGEVEGAGSSPGLSPWRRSCCAPSTAAGPRYPAPQSPAHGTPATESALRAGVTALHCTALH